MGTDPELKAMQAILAEFETLEDEAVKARVWDYVGKRLGLALGAKLTPLTPKAAAIMSEVRAKDPSLYEHFADLYDATRPQLDTEKALVAGYWVQFCQGASDFGSQALNTELKQLGYPIGNITRALDGLIATRPNLVQQMRKDGTTKQARKTFRLTIEGKKRVEQMIARGNDPDAGPIA